MSSRLLLALALGLVGCECGDAESDPAPVDAPDPGPGRTEPNEGRPEDGTGEITLRGRVIAVGGVKEKAVAALRSGMSRVVLPKANENDLETLPDEVLAAMSFDLVKTMDEVMDAVLAGQPEPEIGVPLSHG